jgi:hypothetical protein
MGNSIIYISPGSRQEIDLIEDPYNPLTQELTALTTQNDHQKPSYPQMGDHRWV